MDFAKLALLVKARSLTIEFDKIPNLHDLDPEQAEAYVDDPQDRKALGLLQEDYAGRDETTVEWGILDELAKLPCFTCDKFLQDGHRTPCSNGAGSPCDRSVK